MALHDIPYQISNLLDLYDQAMYDPEFEGDREATKLSCLDTIESLGLEADKKVEYFVKDVKNLEVDSNAVAEEIKRLQARKKNLENRIDGRKKYIQLFMETIGKEKMEAGTFKLWVQNNPKSLKVDMLAGDLPEEFKKTTITIDADKDAIKKALNEGTLPVGIAHYEQTRSLRIK